MINAIDLHFLIQIKLTQMSATHMSFEVAVRSFLAKGFKRAGVLSREGLSS